MIKSDKEYKNAQKQVKRHEENVLKQKETFQELGLTGAEISKALEPANVFIDQLKDEIKLYEELKNGNIESIIYNFDQVGQALIALRISQGLTQLELARRLNVSAAQVCRDEANEYYNATLTKIKSVLEALKVPLIITTSNNLKSA